MLQEEKIEARIASLKKEKSELENINTFKSYLAARAHGKKIEAIDQSLGELEKFKQFQVNQRVNDSIHSGTVIQLDVTNGGLPQVWVAWDDYFTVPELPRRLQICSLSLIYTMELKPEPDSPELPKPPPTVARSSASDIPTSPPMPTWETCQNLPLISLLLHHQSGTRAENGKTQPTTETVCLQRSSHKASLLEESSTSTVSSSENVLRVMKEPETVLMVSNSPNVTISTSPEIKDNSSAVLMVTPDNGNPVTISTNSENHGEREAVLMVMPDNSNPVTISTQRRGKGLGTGRIQWRTVTKKNGKQYQQAWYDWQTLEGGKTQGKSAYIPKRLLTKVQALEAASSPVQEVLRVLEVGKRLLESSICPACQQPLSSLERGCGVCGWESSDSISPNKEVEDFIRGNSPMPGQSISPNKKGRGKNQISASGSLVPVVQKKQDKQGRIVEYPKVEGERVHRSAAFDYPHQFNWQYCYSVQDEDDCWQTLKVSVPPERVWSVRSAIAVDKPMSFILSLIRGRGFY